VREYRVVPIQWEYRSKVHRFQSEASYRRNAPESAYPRDKFRHESREVGPWEAVKNEEGN
jgi:hypothetical protein